MSNTIQQALAEFLKGGNAAQGGSTVSADASYSIDTLKQSTKPISYTPLSEAEIQSQARAQYDNAYTKQVQGAKDAYAWGELAYDRQGAQLADGYAREADQAKWQTAQTVSQTDRSALTRGMQRSSYNQGTLANIRLAGDSAVSAIGQARTRAEGDLSAQRTLSTQQFAKSLEQAQNEYETNVLTYQNKLKDREYQRVTDATRSQNELAMQLWEANFQVQKQQQEQDRWLQEFNEEARQYEEGQAAKGAFSGTGAAQIPGSDYKPRENRIL